MDLFLVRHAIAEDREEFAARGEDDRLRPLTAKGQKRMAAIVNCFQGIHPQVDLIATSPWVRAKQTADIWSLHYKDSEVEEVAELVPDNSVSPFMRWLEMRSSYESIVVVGHEPYISTLACSLLTGSGKDFVYFKKSGIMHIGDREGQRMLLGYYPPRLFRAFSAD